VSDSSEYTHGSLEVVNVFGFNSVLDSGSELCLIRIPLQVLSNLGSIALGEVNPTVSVGELHLNKVQDRRFARSNVLDLSGHGLRANLKARVAGLLLKDFVSIVSEDAGGDDTSHQAAVDE
jgi:hypothetical protein